MMHPTEMPDDLQIARQAKLLSEIAASMSIGEHLLEPYGDAVAKTKSEAIEELADRSQMRMMPGLGRHPAAERIDMDESGQIVGLS